MTTPPMVTIWPSYTNQEDAMTTPTPRTDALTKRMAGELDRPMLQQDHFIELCDHARQLERDLAAAQEALKAAEGQVERLLLDSEAAHAAITALRDDRTRLQQALYFWLPSIAGEETPAGERAAKDSRLLISPELKDEPSAQELGWIVMDSEAKLLREERDRAEALAESLKAALTRIRNTALGYPYAGNSCGDIAKDALDAAFAGEPK